MLFAHSIGFVLSSCHCCVTVILRVAVLGDDCVVVLGVDDCFPTARRSALFQPARLRRKTLTDYYCADVM